VLNDEILINIKYAFKTLLRKSVFTFIYFSLFRGDNSFNNLLNNTKQNVLAYILLIIYKILLKMHICMNKSRNKIVLKTSSSLYKNVFIIMPNTAHLDIVGFICD